MTPTRSRSKWIAGFPKCGGTLSYTKGEYVCDQYKGAIPYDVMKDCDLFVAHLNDQYGEETVAEVIDEMQETTPSNIDTTLDLIRECDATDCAMPVTVRVLEGESGSIVLAFTPCNLKPGEKPREFAVELRDISPQQANNSARRMHATHNKFTFRQLAIW